MDCITRSLSSFPNVTFKISGQAFTLTPLQYILILNDENNDYVCYTIFVPLNINDSNGNLFWILGDYFLYRFYAVFDLINRQVGLATSISYNWTQPVDPTLFNTTTITESLIATMSITTGISITSVSNVTLQITIVSSTASEMKTFFHDILNVILLILSIFLVKLL